jgi:hypothetical protein
MRLAIMLGYPFENTLLRRRVCYTIDCHIVVEGERDAASLYAAADSRMTRPHLRCGNHIRTRSSTIQSGHRKRGLNTTAAVLKAVWTRHWSIAAVSDNA